MSEQTNSNRTARPTVFFVAEDRDVRRLLTQSMRGRDYCVRVAACLQDAREWVEGGGHVHADLVLLDLVRKSLDETFRLGRELCDHAGYDGRTPLVVMADNVPEELAGRDVNVGGRDWICYLADDPGQLPRLLARLLPGTASEARVSITAWARSYPAAT